MTFDELVTTLREEHQKLCNYTTSLDYATKGLYEPDGTTKEIKHLLWCILNSYTRAIYAVKHYEEERKEQDECKEKQ